jgi:hypothetical protein
MQVEDMKQLVKEANELRMQMPDGPGYRALYAIVLVVSELVAREDERVRLGK